MPFPFVARAVALETPAILNYVVLGLIGLAVAFVVLFTVTMFITSLWEKQLVSPFARRDDDSGAPPPYLAEMDRAIAEAGFIDHVPARHVKGGTYRMFASGWLSPGRETLVIASGGTMVRIPYRRTILQTWVGDRLYMTTDETGTPDQTGFVDTQVLKNADFPELWSAHLARLQPVWHLVRPYEAGLDPLACYAANNRARAEAMHRRGLVRYTSPQQEAWRSTIKGAVLLTAASLAQTFTAGQPDRMKMPRPGDAKYVRSSSASPLGAAAFHAEATQAPEATAHGYAWPAYQDPSRPAPPPVPVGAIPYASADPDENWYPIALGRPDLAGAQEGVRFAYFAVPRRLVVRVGPQTAVYDTAQHVITGIAPRHWGDGSTILFTTQFGVVSLHQLQFIPT